MGDGAGRVAAGFGESLSGQLMRYQFNAPILKTLLGEAGFSGDGHALDRLLGTVAGDSGAGKAKAVGAAETGPA